MDGVKKVAVDAIRAAGRVFEVAGRGLESNTFVEKIQPSLRSVSLQGSTPSTGKFVAPTASVIGKVKIGKSSSVWYGAVVRGKLVLLYMCLRYKCLNVTTNQFPCLFRR